MVCNLKPGGKGIEVGKQYVQVELTKKGKDTVVWNRYKKAVRSDYHQAMLYFKATSKGERVHPKFAMVVVNFDRVGIYTP